MVNGAGLAMATVDIIKYYGGEPANFLDIGGQSSPEDNAKAFKIMLEGGQAKGIFVNIFGGINRCDKVAEGIVKASQLIDLNVPIVVRLEGTNVEEGREILKNANVPGLIMAESMEQGAQKIVELVKKCLMRGGNSSWEFLLIKNTKDKLYKGQLVKLLCSIQHICLNMVQIS